MTHIPSCFTLPLYNLNPKYQFLKGVKRVIIIITIIIIEKLVDTAEVELDENFNNGNVF